MRLCYKFFHRFHPAKKDPTLLSIPSTGCSSFAFPYSLPRHLLCCLLLTISFACLVTAAILTVTHMSKAALASRVADQVLRFHVIAHSDSPEDQALKLDVRDALIAYMAQHSSDFDNADEAAAFAAGHCDKLQQIAQEVIHRSGQDYSATASVTLCDFPDKTYGDLTFPAGEYQALRVEIGEAQGQNWWCILYPLLCFTEEGLVTVPTESQKMLQDRLSDQDYQRLQVRFWLWDWLQGRLDS